MVTVGQKFVEFSGLELWLWCILYMVIYDNISIAHDMNWPGWTLVMQNLF